MLKDILKRIYEYAIKSLDGTKIDYNKQVKNITLLYYIALIIFVLALSALYIFSGTKIFFDLLK